MAFRIIVTALVFLLTACAPSKVRNGPRIQSYANLHRIGIALRDYQDKRGSLPPKLSSLFPEFLKQNECFLFYDPQHSPPPNWEPSMVDSNSSYIYLGANGSGVIAHERTNLWANYPDRPDEVAALYADFHVQRISTSLLPQLTNEASAHSGK